MASAAPTGRALAILVAGALLLCEAAAASSGVSKSMTQAAATRRHCVGRFSLDLPASFVPAGESYTFDYVEIEHLARPPGDMAWQQAWDARLAELRALERPPGRSSTVVRELELDPRTRGVFFYGNLHMARQVTLGGLRDAGTRLVWLTAYAFEGKEPILQEVVSDVAGAYRPLEPDSQIPAGAFCVGSGAVLLPYRTMETAYARFEDSKRGVEIEIETESTLEPTRKGLIGRFAEVLTTLIGGGISVDRLRAGAREVAGLPGEEVLARLGEGADVEFSFDWLYPGDPDSGARPEISIQLTAPDGESGPVIEEWDAVLASVRPT